MDMTESGTPNVKIVIAVHKKYDLPTDPLYLPVHVGAAGSPLDFGLLRDDTGDNISEKNPHFCELTGLYWAWKHLDADYIGLVHYRRYLSLHKKGGEPLNSVLSTDELSELFPKYRIVVPKRRHYMIETLYSHYKHTHYEEHLVTTRDIIAEQCPEYLEDYDQVSSQTSGHMFNMMIMTRELLDAYCTWLFHILFELERRLGNPEQFMSPYQGRLYGRVSEIILNVWLLHQVRTKTVGEGEIKELSCVCTEKVNWYRKGISFLRSKFFNKKYEGSF